MRVAAVGWLASTESEVLDLAAAQAAVSHDHPDAIAAARAVDLSIFLLRKNVAPQAVRERLTGDFHYDLSPERTLSRGGGLDISAAGTVPRAFVVASEFQDWVQCERPSVSAEMPIRLLVSPVPWPEPFTACPITSPSRPARI
ncbi:ADP-ribosylglycohydrolase [Bradyrhizobium sp. USDA 4524]|nr:ADP-ribosylglycohydrolase [Bradyrhizobium sp. USDA 4538]MCP1905719.1 ADP-ribosylglycohydrolase [Bradyrhizobium sp. USDA 4537]MCP1988625.1 ADP-ribosylglycohydrolase [Bradyrhizobium sp. USDA 4539]MCP3418120.1 hypothetical protein [Bradyrhizobium brasilense]